MTIVRVIPVSLTMSTISANITYTKSSLRVQRFVIEKLQHFKRLKATIEVLKRVVTLVERIGHTLRKYLIRKFSFGETRVRGVHGHGKSNLNFRWSSTAKN